jgi:hypothetical protein
MDMSARNYWAPAVALGIAFFLTACGDLGMVLPSQGSYRVNAQVDGEYNLDTYSVVAKNSKIRPYFVNSVVNDPDVRGLTVFVQDYSGVIVSRKVHYQLPVEAKETQKPTDKPELPVLPVPPAPAAPAKETDPKDIVEEVSRDEQPKDKTGETGEDPQADNQESSEKLPGDDPEDPEANIPADSFNDPGALAEAEIQAADGADSAHAANKAGDSATGAADRDIQDTETANNDTADNDTGIPGSFDSNTADNDTGAPGSFDSNTTGTNAGNADPVNKDTAEKNAKNTDAIDVGAVIADSQKTETADKDAADQNAKNTGAVGNDDVIADSQKTADRDDKNTTTAGNNTVGTDAKKTEAPDKGTADKNAKSTDAIIDAGASGRDNKNTEAANKDAAGTNAPGKDAAGTDAADTNAPDKDAVGTDAAGTDAGDTDPADKAGTNTAGSSPAGADSGGTGTVPAPLPAPAPPPPLPEKVKPPIPEDETVVVKQLDQYLPAFQIVEELDIGRYNLVFQVTGEKEILYRTYRPIYFIGDAKFILEEIQSFLPVAITGGRLIPPGINVMLGIEISSDPRLDPYIIWHNGKKIIAQGRLSEGTNYLLWKTPEQTGFHSIRAEVFPLRPGDRMPGNMLGKIKELSLPVSSKSEGLRRFSDPAGEFINWHQLWGTLDDAKAKNNSERRLIPLSAQTPRWTPFGGMYGLLVGPDDVYALPGMPFKLSGDAQGTGRILLHFAALSEGSILNIRFAGGEIPSPEDARKTVPAGTAALDLSFAGDALSLRIASGDLSREESLELKDDGVNSFITVTVEFTIAQDHFDAELRMENPAGTTGPLSIALATPISGEGALRFGSSDYAGYKRSAKQTASGEAGKYNGTMVLNELALLYARLPFPDNEEDAESDLPETLTVAEEYPGAESKPPAPNSL